MKLSINGDILQVKLNPLEVLLAQRLILNIPLDRIRQVSTLKPEYDWGQVRAPGTHIPFLIKAGSFYGRNSFEFWQTTAGIPYLIIELINWEYDRIVLTLSNNQVWAEKISTLLRIQSRN